MPTSRNVFSPPAPCPPQGKHRHRHRAHLKEHFLLCSQLSAPPPVDAPTNSPSPQDLNPFFDLFNLLTYIATTHMFLGPSIVIDKNPNPAETYLEHLNREQDAKSSEPNSHSLVI
ncbi:hypothetical protein Salat_1610600 [Sesamum alatum]|uniref:Uncharacterized protein n=1 Tax=Sesamum alatum TaxID=300844 RepID=A0AAE2CJ77_9LAMI|nr:hypothetical protein Salat_1610600 [Sesamum alatum]